jgi:hypothetical protein
MKYFPLFTTLFLLAGLHAQSPVNVQTSQSNWQQKVDHEIFVDFDAPQRLLRCNQTISYTNNSPDVLTHIPFHIWPNAFSSNNTAYGREAKHGGNEKFLTAKETDRGFLDSLSFTVNGKAATYQQYDKEADIVDLLLPEPLQPGASITIATPFRVKIPFLFSRMGYEGKIVSLTQWYPKPAVYDVNGWNVFPYLEQGEYFSEFGRYVVHLTVPANQIVGATGVLQEESETEWLTTLSDGETELRKASDRKTLTYVQDDVPDFAWFASAAFTVGIKKVTLHTGKVVQAMALIDESAVAAPSSVLDGIETALTYYSKRVGEYPYGYCTAVIGGLTAAGGMEYPMITICSDGSRGTVIHEVGHNWFQCILGSQERRYPWMDESINTFYQIHAEGEAPKPWATGKAIEFTGQNAMYHIAHDLGVFQSGTLASDAYQKMNYGTIVYTANPMRFVYLQEVLGRKMFDSCMHEYYRNWKFKHPLPSDIQAVFERVSGTKLDWFFTGLLGEVAPDLAISSVKRADNGYKIRVKTKGNYSIPASLEFTVDKKKEIVKFNSKDTTIFIPNADYVRVNPEGYLTESRFDNNEAKTHGLMKKVGAFKFGFPYPYKLGEHRVWFLPNLISGNAYDGYTPGILFSNLGFPRKNWEWWAAPSYGLRSSSLVGFAGIQRNVWFRKGPFTMLEIGVRGKQYNFRPDSVGMNRLFTHINPNATLYFKRKKSWVQHSISANYFINNFTRTVFGNSDLNNRIGKLEWLRNSYRGEVPSVAQIAIENGNNIFYAGSLTVAGQQYNFTKLSGRYTKNIAFRKSGKVKYGMEITVFGTALIQESNTSAATGQIAPMISGANGANDYAFSEVLMGRSAATERRNLWSQQLLHSVYGLRLPVALPAQTFATGLNMSSMVIPKLPLNVYGDVVYADVVGNTKDFYWVAGLSYRQTLNGNVVFEVNFPLVYSSQFEAAMTALKPLETITFKMNIDMYSIWKLARNIYK